MITESFNQPPLAKIAPSYLYFEHSDDDDLQAFVAAYNEITQGYLYWFNQTPLAVYVNASISGKLLDWIATGIYGYPRPVFVIPTVIGDIQGGYGYSVYGGSPYGKLNYSVLSQGNATFVNDDIYKRSLTWHLYRGDGLQVTVPWLKKRVARFLYGSNGGDMSQDVVQNISVSYVAETRTINITIPELPISETFISLFENNFLEKPFQFNFSVSLMPSVYSDESGSLYVDETGANLKD